MNSYPPIVLASSSPRRQELLKNLGLPFTIQVSDIDETVSPDLKPEEIVQTLSFQKAEVITRNLSFGLVIGSDTIVVLDGQVLGKPTDEQDAYRMLRALSGRMHQVFTGIAIIDVASGKAEVSYSSTYVTMEAMTDETIYSYIASGEPMDKAGSYAIQGLGATLVQKIEGDYFTVVGLPLHLLAHMLTRFGVSLLNR
ncbi:Maf family protein [Brevibacillus daliensis]|uniref:Maf family protein n=1 Tax=Brevibacillus daliensis TaxID=2892995 RepID=UPI001E30A65C|nr:Maf family protein [Brevibacillus daliensis]